MLFYLKISIKERTEYDKNEALFLIIGLLDFFFKL